LGAASFLFREAVSTLGWSAVGCVIPFVFGTIIPPFSSLVYLLLLEAASVEFAAPLPVELLASLMLS
jgi:hypothetical protein